MAFEGYFEFDGIEIVNNSRLSEYAKRMKLGWFNCQNTCPTLPESLEELNKYRIKKVKTPVHYSMPDADKAPWWDANVPRSKQFAGVHVLSIQNIDSSTWEAVSVESNLDGGSVQGGRYGSREMVFRVLLVGESLLGVRYGFDWLATILRGGDVCAHSERTRHIYADFLASTKPWWLMYKRSGGSPMPDNVFQANQYIGLANGPESAQGNTYANLSKNGVDGHSDDVLDIMLPLGDSEHIERTCAGNMLSFFIECPEKKDVQYQYRFLSDVSLTVGLKILNEHVMSVSGCDAGAWQEVEFTLTASNPKVWWLAKSFLAEAEGFTYDEVLDNWIVYRDEDLLVDNDVYQAPLYANREHTYDAVIKEMWDRAETRSPSRMIAAPTFDVPNSLASITDPLCPPAPQFPMTPPSEYMCHQIYEGNWISTPYNIKTYYLPKFTPAAVTVYLESEVDLHDVIVRVVPGNIEVDTRNLLMLYVTYIPAGAALLIDGVSQRIDMRITDPQDSSLRLWTSAEHLVYATPAGGGYRYPEIVCGRKFFVMVEHPEIYDASSLTVDIGYTPRDG